MRLCLSLLLFLCSIPSVALDLLGSEGFTKDKHMVESFGYGGAAAPPTIPRAVSKLPGAPAVGYVLFGFALPYSTPTNGILEILTL